MRPVRRLPPSLPQITELNEEVERVNSERQRLDSELELIKTQQSELEDILSGLEEGTQSQLPVISSHHADMERTRT